jgi:hypothetical protein
VVESVVLSDRSRALLRCIVAAFDTAGEVDGAPGAPVLVPGDDLGTHAAWPCDVPPPTRDELTPLRMQGLVTVAAAGDRLTVSPTALGREAAGLLAPTAAPTDDGPVSRRLVERVAELVEAEPDAETRLRLRRAWAVVGPTVERAAEDVAPERRSPLALAVRARALRRLPVARARR